MPLLATTSRPRQNATAGEKTTGAPGEPAADSAGCCAPVLRFASKPTQGPHDRKGSSRGQISWIEASCVQISGIEASCVQAGCVQTGWAQTNWAQVPSRQRPL